MINDVTFARKYNDNIFWIYHHMKAYAITLYSISQFIALCWI